MNNNRWGNREDQDRQKKNGEEHRETVVTLVSFYPTKFKTKVTQSKVLAETFIDRQRYVVTI